MPARPQPAIPSGPTGDPLLDRFINGRSCAEAVAGAFAAEFGLPEDVLRRAACGFAGGIGGLGGTCGAVSGAIMAIGLLRAPEDPTEREAKQPVLELVRRFVADFEGRFGSVACADLVGRRLDSADLMRAAREEGMFARVCPAFLIGARDMARAVLDLPPAPAPRRPEP